MPSTSWPRYELRQTTPESIIEAAWEPASGLVRPKQGISSPRASRGSQKSCCALVPNCSNNSPGPSEFGTMAVTAAQIEHDDSLRITSEWAKAEKPSPPYCFGMIIAKNLRDFRNSQTSGGRSCHCQLIFHSSSMPQSSSTGPERNCCSSSESFAAAKARSFRESGLPVNS